MKVYVLIWEGIDEQAVKGIFSTLEAALVAQDAEIESWSHRIDVYELDRIGQIED